MGPLLVKLSTEDIEAHLLRCLISIWRPSGFGFEGTMHSLMTSILLRLSGRDTLGFYWGGGQ